MPLRLKFAQRSDKQRDGRGFALITVLATLSITLVLLIGMLGLAETELKSSRNFGETIEVRALSDVATNLVIAQIRRATHHDVATPPVSWSSQPGALHVWDSSGVYREGYKLYSDSMMFADTAVEILNDQPEVTWDQQPGRYADLNEPSVLLDLGGSVVTRFPVADPRAAADDPATAEDDRVEGFTYTADIDGVVPPGSVRNPDDMRLPMPVEWFYVLEDGTLGTVEKSGGVYTFQGTTTPTRENPIVGRLAYWADDETSKLNVNTATEPTPWDTPRAGNKVDYDYGRYQPAQNEWQRYPGHPAVTGLGPALFPNRDVAVAEKEELYKVLPRVVEGGTISGTVRPGQVLQPDGDRLFAAVEEFLLTPDRTLQTLVSPARMDLQRFFLTAQSQAPELNAFGYPRVAIWPVGGPGFPRTVFDNLIAFCSTVGGKEYFFQRIDPNSATRDWTDIERNRQMYAYLQRLTSTRIPGVGKKTLEDKWGADRDQILTEIFDYIRCANLREKTPGGRHYAGSGQVVPIELASNSTKGFGRFYSISEYALHFICNGDGDDVDGDGNQPDGNQPDDGPLSPGERLVECAFLLEPFCPSQGFYVIGNDFSVRVKGLENFKLDGESLDFQVDAFRKPGNLAGSWHGRNWGGPAGVRTWIGSSGNSYQFRGRKAVKVNVSGGTDTDNGTMQFSGGMLTVEIFYGGTPDPTKLIQTMQVNFPSATFPVPKLVKEGTTSYRGATAQSKEWWWTFGSRYSRTTACPHAAGAEYEDPLRRWPGGNGGFKEGSVFRFEDVVRSVVPYHGDMRLVAGVKNVPASVFQPHHFYNDTKRRVDHLLNDSQGTHLLYGFSNEPGLNPYLNASDQLTTNMGFDPVNNATDRVAQLNPVKYHYSRLPDVPIGTGAFNLWGDFDNGVAQIHDGAYINKPDEGNVAGKGGGVDGNFAYFAWNFSDPTVVNFSPNRMMPSPGMFGSLPTAIKRNRPWETLLFRPQAGHPGEALPNVTAGEVLPADHELLDLFWMPVIEPWAVSEPFATKGKVNLNHAIAPFSYITRTTALRGVLASEEMLEIPNEVSKSYKLWDHETSDHPWLPKEVAGNTDPATRQQWSDLEVGTIKIRNRIDADQTLLQFTERFANGRPFRAASEICEIHLVGEGGSLSDYRNGTFAKDHVLSGDNTRERPYTNLYPRLTSRSNTFRVHVRSQVISKARSSDPEVFDPTRDTVAAEYRGSTLIERYIDPTDTAIPDYATAPDAEPLTRYYKFRVVNESQFLP